MNFESLSSSKSVCEKRMMMFGYYKKKKRVLYILFLSSLKREYTSPERADFEVVQE